MNAVERLIVRIQISQQCFYVFSGPAFAGLKFGTRFEADTFGPRILGPVAQWEDVARAVGLITAAPRSPGRKPLG